MMATFKSKPACCCPSMKQLNPLEEQEAQLIHLDQATLISVTDEDCDDDVNTGGNRSGIRHIWKQIGPQHKHMNCIT